MAEKRVWIERNHLKHDRPAVYSRKPAGFSADEYVHIAEVQRLIRKAYSEGESDYAETGRCMKWEEAG